MDEQYSHHCQKGSHQGGRLLTKPHPGDLLPHLFEADIEFVGATSVVAVRGCRQIGSAGGFQARKADAVGYPGFWNGLPTVCLTTAPCLYG